MTEKKKKEKTVNSEIIDRLDAIIRLQIASLSPEKDIQMYKIYSMLQDSGLSTTEIGKIFKSS